MQRTSACASDNLSAFYTLQQSADTSTHFLFPPLLLPQPPALALGKTHPGGDIDPDCTLVNPLQGMTAAAAAAGGTVTFAQGCEIDGTDTSMIAAAVAVAKDAEVAVVVGGIITCQETGLYCQEV